MMRLARSMPRSLIGDKRALMREYPEGNGRVVRNKSSFETGSLPEERKHSTVAFGKACGTASLHQGELQQQRALDQREIVVGDHGQHGVALVSHMGVDAFHIVDLL